MKKLIILMVSVAVLQARLGTYDFSNVLEPANLLGSDGLNVNFDGFKLTESTVIDAYNKKLASIEREYTSAYNDYLIIQHTSPKSPKVDALLAKAKSVLDRINNLQTSYDAFEALSKDERQKLIKNRIDTLNAIEEEQQAKTKAEAARKAAEIKAKREKELEAKKYFNEASKGIQDSIEKGDFSKLTDDVAKKLTDLEDGQELKLTLFDGTYEDVITVIKDGSGYSAIPDIFAKYNEGSVKPDVFGISPSIDISNEVKSLAQGEAKTPTFGISQLEGAKLSISSLEDAYSGNTQDLISKLTNVEALLRAESNLTPDKVQEIVSRQFKGINWGEDVATTWNNFRTDLLKNANSDYNEIGEGLPEITPEGISRPDVF